MKRQLEQGTDGHWRTHFESVTEFIGYTHHGECVSAENIKESAEHAHDCATESWACYTSFEKVERMMHEAPQDILEAIDRIKTQIESSVAMPAKMRRKRIHRQEMGDELNPDAWLHRDSDGWDDTHKIRVPKNSIKIGVNMWTRCDMKRHNLICRGATALALADLLIQQGNNVELIAFMTGTLAERYHTPFTVTIQVKDMMAPLDMSSAAVSLADIGFYRLVGIGCEIKLSRARNSGGSFASELPASDKAQVDVLVEQNCLDEKSAVAFVKAQLQKFNHHLEM